MFYYFLSNINIYFIEIKSIRLTISNEVGRHFDHTITYDCVDCTVADVLCNGESSLTSGRVSVIPITKMINFNFPRYLFILDYLLFF